MRISSFVKGVIVKGSHGAWAFPNEVKNLFQVFDQQLLSRDSHFLETSKYLFDFLSKTSFPQSAIQNSPAPVMYRRVSSAPPANDPLSVMGSFGTGGRLNIGGSQSSGSMTRIFKGYAAKRSALYLSEDSDTARKEYGDFGMPAATGTTYKIGYQTSQQVALIDLDLAVAQLGAYFPALSDIISKDSYGAIYGDVKVVMATQLLANWLLIESKSKVNGIIFNSTRNIGKRNYCLYFDNDAACKDSLVVL